MRAANAIGSEAAWESPKAGPRSASDDEDGSDDDGGSTQLSEADTDGEVRQGDTGARKLLRRATLSRRTAQSADGSTDAELSDSGSDSESGSDREEYGTMQMLRNIGRKLSDRALWAPAMARVERGIERLAAVGERAAAQWARLSWRSGAADSVGGAGEASEGPEAGADTERGEVERVWPNPLLLDEEAALGPEALVAETEAARVGADRDGKASATAAEAAVGAAKDEWSSA